MDTYQTVVSRRTIRLFEQRPIPADLMERIVDAARLAPSAGNQQVLELIVVQEPANCARLFEHLQWGGHVRPKRNPPEGKRPTAYVIVLIRGAESGISGVPDAAAAVENMILTAWNEGVGSCWIGSVDREEVARLFDVPSGYRIFDVVALGYPGERPVVEVLTDSHKYWLDENDVLHVPKRPLKDIVHHEKFSKERR